MSSPAYLPNTQPKNNSTAQIRRRVNDLVSQAVGQQTASNTNAEDISALEGSVAGLQAAVSKISSSVVTKVTGAAGISVTPATGTGSIIITSTVSEPNFADNEILSGSGTAWTFDNAPISNLPTSTSVHLYVLEYVGGPFVRLPTSAIVSIIGVNMVTVNPYSAGALMADYRY
jgi:hypothetical protein